MKRIRMMVIIAATFAVFLCGCGIAPVKDGNQAEKSLIVAEEQVPPLSEQVEEPVPDLDKETLLSDIPSETVLHPETEPAPAANSAPKTSSLEIDFLDVGFGDAALISCDGMQMLADGGDALASSRLYTELESRGITSLEYIAASCLRDEHVGGLAGALNIAAANIFLSPSEAYDSDRFRAIDKYFASPLTVPTDTVCLPLGAAEIWIYPLDTVNGPILALRIVHGDNSILFVPDGGSRALLDSGIPLDSTVLKLGDHGGEDSLTEDFLRAVSPQFALIGSDGETTPAQTTLDTLRDAGIEVWRTDLHGDIQCCSDGIQIRIVSEKVPDRDPFLAPGMADIPVEPDSERNLSGPSYVANTNTGKFHYPSCSSVGDMNPENRWDYTGTREELIDMGYVPCKRCKP